MSRLKKLELNRQKTLRSSQAGTERVQNFRAEYWEKVKDIETENLVFLDETGIILGLARTHARSKKGTRVYEMKPFYHGAKVAVIGAISFKKVVALMTMNNSMDGKAFELSPFIACHQKILDEFLDDFWDYYRDLLAYKNSPSQQTAEKLRSEFWNIFSTESGYQQLDERKRLTRMKISELLLVLEHPELPLHNKKAELAARTMMVQRPNISYATQTLERTQAWDTFMSLVATTCQLGISFFEYIRDRISQLGNIPSLATIIQGKICSQFFWFFMDT